MKNVIFICVFILMGVDNAQAHELTVTERAVLEHVVIDADGWFNHVVNTFGEKKAIECLKAKVLRHEEKYRDALVSEGSDYKTRAEREKIRE